MQSGVGNIVEQVIDAVDGKLPERDTANARELLRHGEWGEALSLIYTQLDEYDVKIPKQVFEMINSAGGKMEMNRRGWEILKVED